MAVAFTQLAAATNSTSNAASYAGNAGTPASGDLLVCFVHLWGSTGGTLGGTMTGTWTWSRRFSFTFNGGADSMFVFTAKATAATSTTPTFDCTGDNGTACSIYCLRVTGDSAYLPPYFRQIKSATGSSTNPAVTMDRAILTGSGVCGFASNGTNSATQWTAPGSWTENSEVAMGTAPNGSAEVASRASGETGSTITWTNSNTTNWGIAVLEIAVDGSVPFYENDEDRILNRASRKSVVKREDPAPNLLCTTLLPVTVMPRKHQMQVQPKRAKRDLNELEVPNLLTSTLAVADATPFIADIPESRVAARKSRPGEEIIPNLLTSTLASGQLIVPRHHQLPPIVRKRRPIVDEVIPNLLTSTLSASAAEPFVQVEPAERAPRKTTTRVDLDIPNLLASTLFVAPADPLYPHDIQVRAIRRPRAITADEPPSLLTTTLAEPVVIVPRKHQFPANPPRKKRRLHEEVIPNLLTSTLGEVALEPRVAIVQALPKKRKRPVEDVIPNLLTSTLFVAPPSPSTPIESQECAPKRIKPRVEEAVPNLLTTTLAEILEPRVAIVQPLPRRRRATHEYIEQANLLITTLATPTGKPELVDRVPPRRVPHFHEDIPNLLMNTLSPPIAPPFVQSEVMVAAPRHRTPFKPNHDEGTNPNLYPPPPPPDVTVDGNVMIGFATVANAPGGPTIGMGM